jgi:hypothetical protein
LRCTRGISLVISDASPGRCLLSAQSSLVASFVFGDPASSLRRALRWRCLRPSLALIGPLFSLIREFLAAVGHPFALVRDLLSLIGDSIPLIGHELASIGNSVAPGRLPSHLTHLRLLAGGLALSLQRLSLALQGSVVGPQSGPAAPYLPFELLYLVAPPAWARLAPRSGAQPLKTDPIRFEVRQLFLELGAPPLEVSPLTFAARVPERSRGLMPGSALLVRPHGPLQYHRGGPGR